jgi:hypothetical protein
MHLISARNLKLAMINSSGKMITTIHQRNYIDLLDRVEIVPKVIETESEYARFLMVMNGK